MPEWDSNSTIDDTHTIVTGHGKIRLRMRFRLSSCRLVFILLDGVRWATTRERTVISSLAWVWTLPATVPTCCVWWFEWESIGSYVWMFGPQLVGLFAKDQRCGPVGGGLSLRVEVAACEWRSKFLVADWSSAKTTCPPPLPHSLPWRSQTNPLKL